MASPGSPVGFRTVPPSDRNRKTDHDEERDADVVDKGQRPGRALDWSRPGYDLLADEDGQARRQLRQAGGDHDQASCQLNGDVQFEVPLETLPAGSRAPVDQA
jgi:hypothetical protein